MGQPFTAAGHFATQRHQAGGRRFVKVQIAIGVIFHHQGLVLDGQLQHFFAALKTQHGTAGVAKGGDQIDQLGLVLGNQRFQLVGLDAMLIHRGRDHFCAIEAKTLNSGQKGRAFNDDLVTLIQHGLAQQVQRLLAAGGDDELLRSHIRHTLAGHECGQLLAQRLVALSRTVLQRSARLFLQRLGRSGADARHIKHGAVRKTTRKTDDAGLAQQLEQFTDRRGFYVIESFGKLHTVF